jgi:hypothetical protein
VKPTVVCRGEPHLDLAPRRVLHGVHDRLLRDAEPGVLDGRGHRRRGVALVGEARGHTHAVRAPQQLGQVGEGRGARRRGGVRGRCRERCRGRVAQQGDHRPHVGVSRERRLADRLERRPVARGVWCGGEGRARTDRDRRHVRRDDVVQVARHRGAFLAHGPLAREVVNASEVGGALRRELDHLVALTHVRRPPQRRSEQGEQLQAHEQCDAEVRPAEGHTDRRTDDRHSRGNREHSA